MWLWLPEYSEEQETAVQKAGLLWIMWAGGGNKDSVPSIMLLHLGQNCSRYLCVSQLYGAPHVYWTYGNITRLPVSSKAHPKVHYAISSINAGLLRDVAALCYLLFALLIWWLWLVQLNKLLLPSSCWAFTYTHSKASANDSCYSFCRRSGFVKHDRTLHEGKLDFMQILSDAAWARKPIKIFWFESFTIHIMKEL